MKIKTPKEHAENNGMICPVCGHEDMTEQEPEIDIGIVWIVTTCCACKSTWTDKYEIKGYENLEAKRPNSVEFIGEENSE